MHLLRAPSRSYRSRVMDSSHWDHYQPRRDDVVICTFPKVGTTWTQRIVDLLFHQNAEARPVTSNVPWLDATIFGPVEGHLATLEAQTERRAIKSHLPFDSLPIFDDVKYIHVARDGRDAITSMHNHELGFRKEFREAVAGSMSAGMKPPETPEDPRTYFLGRLAQAENYKPDDADLPFFEFENTYWRERKRPNVLFVHFADMKKDLAGAMLRISSFLGIDTPASRLNSLAAAAEFGAMKAQGKELMPAVEIAFDRGSDRFLNKGTNGRWKDFLTAEDIARYEALALKKFSAAEAAWIANGHAAGDPRNLPD